METQKIKLDIFSDPICPWCLIGKRLLDTALAQRASHPFDFEWHPFALNPNMPPEGMERRVYLEHKFGGRQNAVRVYAHIAQAAQEAGCLINFEAIKRTPNTHDAHRLIYWARIENVQSQVVNGLFETYFAQGQDISKPEILIDIGEKAGFAKDVIKNLLASEADSDLIKSRVQQAFHRGIKNVPTFIVNNQHVVAGAQPVDLWLRVIDELNADRGAHYNRVKNNK